MNMNDFFKLNTQPKLRPNLSEGATGDDVIILQDKLKILNYYFASITGSFDARTKQAVINFQKDNLITPTGTVNDETWQMLYNLTEKKEKSTIEIETRPILRRGSTGPYVTELQTLLTNLLYYTGPIDGNFGPTTESAVKRFQINNRLTPDGIVGRDTWSALSSLYSPLAICENGNDTFTYTVVAGDTLWRLAQRFNTTVDIIKRLNNLTSDNLSIGQQLLIPQNL